MDKQTPTQIKDNNKEHRKIYKPIYPKYPMTEKIITKVRADKNGQRRITVPKEDKTLKDNDLVEIKKVETK